MNVLSLFDGLSGAMIALHRLGINPDNYYASEVDKYAIQVSKANWPQIVHIGDVTKVHYFDGMLITEFGSYEVSFAKGLICGGSPCQGFSFAGKQLNFEDPRSKLFFEFVRIWKEIKAEHPDVKVFLENVVMKKEYQSVISEALGIEPVLINSALVCAQNRKRLYWTDIPFQGQPEDNGILLKDILEYEVDSKYALSEAGLNRGLTKKYSSPKFDPDKTGTLNTKNNSGQLSIDSGTTFVSVEQREKSLALTATYAKKTAQDYLNKSQGQMVGVILNHGEYQERNEKAMCLDANYWKGADNHGQRTVIQFTENYVQFGQSSGGHNSQYYRASYPDGKQPTISSGRAEPKVFLGDYSARCQKQISKNSKTANEKTNSLCSNSSITAIGSAVLQNGFTYRKLTVTECERLQGVFYNEIFCIFDLCLDQVRNYVSVVQSNPKLLKSALLAEEILLSENVKNAENNILQKQQKIKHIVAQNADMPIEKQTKKIINTMQKEVNSIALTVENIAMFKNLAIEVDFVDCDVFINIMSGRIIHAGPEGILLNDKKFTGLSNGNKPLKLFGNEIKQLVEDVEKYLITGQANNFTYTILNRLNIKSIEQMLIIYYLFAKNVITGYTQNTIKKSSSLIFKIEDNYTNPVSNSQAYKMLGNGWQVDTIVHLFEPLLWLDIL